MRPPRSDPVEDRFNAPHYDEDAHDSPMALRERERERSSIASTNTVGVSRSQTQSHIPMNVIPEETRYSTPSFSDMERRHRKTQPLRPKIQKHSKSNTRVIDRWLARIKATETWDSIPKLDSVPTLRLFRVLFFILGIWSPDRWRYLRILHQAIVALLLATPLAGVVTFGVLGYINPYVIPLFALAFSFPIMAAYTMSRYISSGKLGKLLYMAAEGAYGIRQDFSAVEKLARSFIRVAIGSSIVFIVGWTSLVVIDTVFFANQFSSGLYDIYAYVRIPIESYVVLVFMPTAGLFSFVLKCHSIAVDHFTALIVKLDELSNHPNTGGQVKRNMSQYGDNVVNVNANESVYAATPASLRASTSSQDEHEHEQRDSTSSVEKERREEQRDNVGIAIEARSVSASNSTARPLPRGLPIGSKSFSGEGDEEEKEKVKVENLNDVVAIADTNTNMNRNDSFEHFRVNSMMSFTSATSFEDFDRDREDGRDGRGDEFGLLKILGRDPIERFNRLMTEYEVLGRDLDILASKLSLYWAVSYAIFAVGLLLGLFLLLIRGMDTIYSFLDKSMVVAFTLASIMGLYHILHAPLVISTSYDRLLDTLNSTRIWNESITSRFVQFVQVKRRSFVVYGIPIVSGTVAKTVYILGAVMIYVIRLGI